MDLSFAGQRKIFVVVFSHQYRSLLFYYDFWEPLKCERVHYRTNNDELYCITCIYIVNFYCRLLHLLYSCFTLQRQFLVCRFSYTVDGNVSVITMTKPKSLASTGISLRKCKSSSKSFNWKLFSISNSINRIQVCRNTNCFETIKHGASIYRIINQNEYAHYVR